MRRRTVYGVRELVQNLLARRSEFPDHDLDRDAVWHVLNIGCAWGGMFWYGTNRCGSSTLLRSM